MSDTEILENVALLKGPATATELGDAVGMQRSGMNKRLDDLVERGLLHEKKVGANAKVYWLTDDGEDHIMTA